MNIRKYSKFKKIIKIKHKKRLIVIIKKGDLSLLKNTSWCLSNFFCGSPIPDFEMVKGAIPTLCDMFINVTDKEAKTDILWALSHIT